jgi:uncharacterized protein YjbJ (UPF0337 family)
MVTQASASGGEAARPDATKSVDEIRTASRDAGQSIRQAAANLGGDALNRTEQKADAAKGSASESLRRVADQVRRAAEGFEGGETGWARDPLQRGAQGLETAAEYLNTATVKDLVRDVQGFAQRNPAAFLAVSVVAGFALARVGKTAAQRSSESSVGTSQNVSAYADYDITDDDYSGTLTSSDVAFAPESELAREPVSFEPELGSSSLSGTEGASSDGDRSRTLGTPGVSPTGGL